MATSVAQYGWARLGLLLAFLLTPLPAKATPAIQFERSQSATEVTLSYRFDDIEGAQQTLSVALPRDALMRTPVLFRPLNQQRLLRDVALIQRRYASEQGWDDARLNIVHQQLQYSLLRGDNNARHTRLQRWQQAEAAAYDEVFAHHYYRTLRQHSGRRGYAPDHPRIAAESQYLLEPFSDAFAELLTEAYGAYSPRQALAYLTHFVQLIPYDAFTDRLSSPGAGFVTPGRLLYEHRGDCDSKVTLLAALMANLFPALERRIVYLPGHAMFALELEPEADDIYVRDAELEFVIADPTGPARLRVGEASRVYQSPLRSGAVTMLAI